MRGRRLFIIALLITVFVGWFAVWGVAEITNWEWNLDAKDKKVEAPIGTIVKVKITSNSTVPTRLLSRPFKEMGEVDTELTDRLDENPVVNGGSDISFRTGGLTAGEYYIIVQERQASDNNLVGQASTSRFTLVEPFIQPVKAPPSIPQTGIPVSSESDNATASTDTPSETRLTRYGFYVSPHANNETMPPYAYYPDPGVFANYDFSVFQAFRTRIYETANLIKAIKKAKPSFKTIVIKQQDMGWTLDYYYNADSRQVELEEFKTLIEQCGVNNVDGVTFHEEEPMNIYGGWFDDKKIPAWAEKYKDIYIEESSDSSWTWETHQANAQYYNWIIQKTIWSYNHLYDSFKKIYPKTKVYLWCPVPPADPVSSWGWIEPATVKKDGYIYEWHNDYPSASLIPDGYEERFKKAIDIIRNSGVDNDEIYVQIWAYRSYDDINFQIDKLKKCGIKNIYAFMFNAWIPPDLPEGIYIKNDYSGTPHDGVYEGVHDFAASRRELLRLNKLMGINEPVKE